MGDIKQKACCRPNFNPWKCLSKATKKQEIWHTHPENLLTFLTFYLLEKLLALKEMKLLGFLQMDLFAKILREG